MLTPVGWQDMEDLVSLKGDPGVYGMMLGGVMGRTRVADELAADTFAWPRYGVGMWIVRDLTGAGTGTGPGPGKGTAIGLTGIQDRADGRGMGLRFAFRPGVRGRGLAREAAGAALRFGHDRARLVRIIAVAREDNLSSRTVLGGIGMRQCDTFVRDGLTLLVFESVITGRAGSVTAQA